MKTITITEPINLKVVKFELDFSPLYDPKSKPEKKCKEIKIPEINCKKKQKNIPNPPQVQSKQKKRDVKELIAELLNDIYADHRDWASTRGVGYSQGSTTASYTSSQSNCGEHTDSIEFHYLETLDISEVIEQASEWKRYLQAAGERLAKYLRVRDRLQRRQKKLCAAFTILLRHIKCQYMSSKWVFLLHSSRKA